MINVIPEHLDTSLPLLDVPDEVKERLRTNEKAQRYATNAINKKRRSLNQPELPVEPVDIIAIAEENDWMCGCHKVFRHTGCFRRVDITRRRRQDGAPVIGHIVARALEGGHTPNNVDLFRAECNDAVANRIEKTLAAKVKRTRRVQTGINEDGTEHTPKPKKAIPTRPDGLQSRSDWGSRKMSGGNSFKRHEANVRHDD